MTRSHDRNPLSGPTGIAARALAPDLARGFMLLLMALAHSYVFLYATRTGLSGLDQATVLIEQTATSERARPMFFFLFGYGLGQLYLRQEARGHDWVSTRSLLRRRGWSMVLIGCMHVALLFYDVIAAYGLASVVLVGVVRASDKKLLWTSGCFLVATFALYLAIGAFSEPLAVTVPAENPVFTFTTRLLGWSVSLVLIGFVLVPAMLVGIWAARRRILDEPERHRPLLVRTAGIGIGLAIAGGLPKATIDSLLWSGTPETIRAFAGAIHGMTGFFGGLGAIALIALISIKLVRGHGLFVSAIQALGQRSLTFYLFQSVVFVAVFAPFAGSLGARTSFAGAAAVAIATWLLSVALAELMRRANHRGPAEILLRRLTYQGQR
jgi:uncharacterized protein